MNGQTGSGRRVIPERVAGQNAHVQGGIYDDDYLKEINDLYPLEDVLGARIDGIAIGSSRDANHFTMGSPLQNSEGEHVLNFILYRSANAGIWQPEIIEVSALTDTDIRTAEEYLERVRTISPDYGRGMIDRGMIYGIARAQSGGLVIPARVGNSVIVIPHQNFVEFCMSRR
ncbi:MAG: hypothetical protein HYW25_02735 [Candidatus Aenigmarchaeota archaeon]|nr:hypothetical protein [Candidatus Aenigmarchaeota archaeon]